MENKEKKNNKRYYPRKKKKRKIHKKANKKPVNIRVYGYCRQHGIPCFYAFHRNNGLHFWIPVSMIDDDSKLYVAIFYAKDDKIVYKNIDMFSMYKQHTEFSDMVNWLLADNIRAFKGFEYNYGRKKLFYENIDKFVEIINK